MKQTINAVLVAVGLVLMAGLMVMCNDNPPEEFTMCEADADCTQGYYCTSNGLCLPLADGDSDSVDNNDTVDSDDTIDSDDAVDPDPVDSADGDIVDGDQAESPHQCLTSDDCDGCSVCIDIGGVNTCVGAGDYQCHSNDDCGANEFCSPYKVTEPQCGGTCEPLQTNDYVLHEWGVNMVTPYGANIKAGPARFWGAVPAKPVLYVYADGPVDIDLGVRFAGGKVTETWPEIPMDRTIEWSGVQVRQGECSLTATPEPDYGSMEPEDKEVYQVPDWRVPDADCLTVGTVTSDLLFYTGRLDGHVPPVTITMRKHQDNGEDVVTFTAVNTLDEAVGPTLLVYRDTYGECVDPSLCPVTMADLAFGVIEGIAAGATETVTVSLMHVSSTDQYQSIEIPPEAEQMRQRLRGILENAGLYDDETDVFMSTWQDMFFGIYAQDIMYFLPDYATGAFAVYLWPENYTTAQLTLRAEPPPKELKRAILQFERIAAPVQDTGTIAGTVTLEEYDGMSDEPMYTGPAAGAVVKAWRPGASEATASATADDQGAYSMTLPTGVYAVTAERNEWETGDRVDNVSVLADRETEVNLTLYSEAMVDKPNLYLYPTETTDVSVRVTLHEGCDITQSIPEYGQGWDVTVAPDGLIDGQYTYLFYEAEIPRRYPMIEGWAVARQDLAAFFNDTLRAYGFTPAETADFVDYWPDHLAPADWYAVYPMVDARYIDPLAGLDIQPVPDSLFRLWLIIEPVPQEPNLLAPAIVPMQRNGFTAVEWGVIQE